MNKETRITELEIKLTEAQRVVDELSDIVADQAKRLDAAERRIQMLMERAAEAEAEGGEVVMGNQPPPHW